MILKKQFYILKLCIICTLLCGFSQISKAEEINNNLFKNQKIAIIYFSWSGNVKQLAKNINSIIKGEIKEITPINPYTGDYQSIAYGRAKEEQEKHILPKIHPINIQDYDIIFLGTPVWWHDMAPVIKTFLHNNNFQNKIIIPFISHGGGGKYQIKENIEKLAKGAKVLKPLVIYEAGDTNLINDIKNWLNNLKIN